MKRVQVESRTWADAWGIANSALGRRVLWVRASERTIIAEVSRVDLEKLKITPGIEVFPEVDQVHPWTD